jgi:hypothetical protein
VRSAPERPARPHGPSSDTEPEAGSATESAPAGGGASASATASAAGETTEALLARSEAALAAAASFRTKSTLTFGEFAIVTNSVHVGDKVKGTQTVSGLKTQFVRIGDDLYINGSEAYWTSKVTLDSLGKVIYKWVKVDANDPTHEPLAPLYRSEAPFREATASGTLTRAGTATVAGRTAIVIKSGEEAVIHIAAEGEPYPLRVEPAWRPPEAPRRPSWSSVISARSPQSSRRRPDRSST